MNTGFYRVAASSPEIYLGDCVNNADNIIHIAESLAKKDVQLVVFPELCITCLLYTSPSPRDGLLSRMPSSA